jgi:hypothetical protein
MVAREVLVTHAFNARSLIVLRAPKIQDFNLPHVSLPSFGLLLRIEIIYR